MGEEAGEAHAVQTPRPDAEVLEAASSLEQGLLTFQKDCVEELLQSDGLSVIGQGLGMCTVVAAFLAVHHFTEDSGGAVIMIGSTHAQRQHVAAELGRLAPSAPPICDVTATMTAPERVHLYRTAPNLFITTRILAVDLLTERLQQDQVAGFIILNAHRATDDSGEGFAVRLLRAKSRTAFVRGLTEDVGQLAVGLSTMEHAMRALLVSRVYFWPRFQETVQHDLGKVDVEELSCDLSPSMASIQGALMKVLDSMLKQVQRNHKLDSSELSLSSAMTRNFDAAIRRQLDPIWNTVPQATHSLVRDIKTVQTLLTYLLRFNCVSFLRYLQCLKAAAGPRTEWMLHSAATTVFQEAKARVYKLWSDGSAASTSSGTAGVSEVKPVLEEQPKWVLLRQLAKEIQSQRKLLASLRAAGGGTAGGMALGGGKRTREEDEGGHKGGTGGALGSGGSSTPVKAARQDAGCQSSRAGGLCEGAGGGDGVIDLCDDSPSIEVGTNGGASHPGPGVGTSHTQQGAAEAHDVWIHALSQEEVRACGEAAVLVVVRERHLLSELRGLLKEEDGKEYLQEVYKAYLLDRADSPGTSRKAGSSGAGGRAGGRRGRGRGAGGSGRGMTRKEKDKYKLQMLMGTPEEEAAMVAAAQHARDHAAAAAAGGPTAAHGSGRGRGRANGDEKRRAAEVVVQSPQQACSKEDGPLLAGFHFLAMEDCAEHVLHAIRPVFVILYDVDVAWVRLLESYNALYTEQPLKAYMLSYDESVEVAKFQVAASREKSAFMSLIRKKAHMVLPVDDSGNYTIVPKTAGELTRGQAAIGATVRTGNALTRRAGGHELIVVAKGGTGPSGGKPRVVVDIREFMSSLPAVLYGRGIHIQPVTLEVGDFVLTPDVCVERKAVPDLISSLDSGRLYTQAVAMCRHYATPVLLLEFDPRKAFALQSLSDMGTDIRGNNVMSKLVILLLNFPKLRLVWARSLHATADMFLSLKGSSPQPDPEAAAEVGLDLSANQGGGIANPVARDMLLDLPGVTPANVHKLMDAAGSLSGLADMSLEKIQEAVGTMNGRALHDFMHASYPAS